MSSPSDLVSPSGDSIVGSLLKGEQDPTVEVFQQGREDIGNSLQSFFNNFFQAFKFIGDWRIWAVIVVVVILILWAIIKKG